MTYIPLYRKWRSQNFSELVGQEFIVQTLQNAIKSGRVAHAYLFSGPRGTGKTSAARIFAKALNCVKGPTPEPCGKCDNCEKIKNGHAVDVTEIDAASNRGIDEIRDLREKVRYAPIEGKYKVYIIDEVHMLTSEAFNALLKTLEEPPTHVIFILATTEPQKVPVTISSRCQRLDFRRLTNSEIKEQLKYIASKEGIKLDDNAAALIARNSEGSLRDGISLFDQLISFSGKDIKHDDVIKVLGTANSDQVFELGSALASNDVKKLFEIIGKMSDEGRSIPQVTKDIILYLRNLLMVMLGSESAVEETDEHINRLKEQSKMFTSEKLQSIIRVLSRAEVDMKWHPQARILLEVAVMEACSAEDRPQAQTKKADVKPIATAQKFEPKPTERKLSDMIPKESTPIIEKGDIMSQIKAQWPQLLETVKKKSVFAYISLHEGEPVGFMDGILTLRFKKGFAFHKERLEEEGVKSSVEAALKDYFSTNIAISSIIESEQQKSQVSPSTVAQLFGGQIVS
jgi:DNA polymerase III subunit gamma/tau